MSVLGWKQYYWNFVSLNINNLLYISTETIRLCNNPLFDPRAIYNAVFIFEHFTPHTLWSVDLAHYDKNVGHPDIWKLLCCSFWYALYYNKQTEYLQCFLSLSSFHLCQVLLLLCTNAILQNLRIGATRVHVPRKTDYIDNLNSINFRI